MELNAGAFYAFWDAGETEPHPNTNKLFYRRIGGFKFQFHKLDYRSQTKLSLRVGALAKRLEPLFAISQQFMDAEGEITDEYAKLMDTHNSALMLKVLPDLLGFVGEPEVEQLLHDLVVTASVDRGKGSFERLSDDVVAEDIFGPDISLQLPVAATALEINLAGFIQRVINGFGSKT